MNMGSRIGRMVWDCGTGSSEFCGTMNNDV
jgi:hypothetical protein